MKVLIISNGHPSPKAPYFYTFIEEQAKALSTKIDCNIIVPIEILLPIQKHHQYIQFAQNFPNLLHSNGYTVYFSRSYRYLPGMNKYLEVYLMIWSVLFKIWRYKIQFDLIHAHFALPSGYIAAVISKIFGKPFILTVHGSDVLDRFVNKELVKRRKKDRNLTLRKADRIICVSTYLKEVLYDFGISPNKATVIPNGIDTDVFSPSKLTNGKSDILFIGNLIELKGVDLLINAFKRLSSKRSDINLKIVGNGQLKSTLKRMVIDSGIDERVKFVDQMENKAIATIIRSSKLLCLPSRQEGFGVVLIEALACGVPVIASRTGGIPDIVTCEDVGLLFEPENVDDLTTKLVLALDKKWNQNLIRQAGLKFSWEVVADRIIEQYKVVI